MLEKEIVRHCAPVLAGLKTANMFSYKYLHISSLQKELQEGNRKLNEKGVYIDILKQDKETALIYVYRRSFLERDLSAEEVPEMLAEYGYAGWMPEQCIQKLKERFLDYEAFPHEVGLFLGYPLWDVREFIQQKGQNYLFCGVWKVYGKETEAKALFGKFRKCMDIYQKLFEDGRSIIKLTVAA